MRNFLIDTDTASDDAVAIIMALSAPDVRVLGLTTVAGNVGLEQATRNALMTADICGSNVPVFVGAGGPLIRAHSTRTGSMARTASATMAIPRPGARPSASTRSTRSFAWPTPSPA
jgi:purine nucleosidase